MKVLTYIAVIELAFVILISPFCVLSAVLCKIFSWIFIKKNAKDIAGEVAVVTGGAMGLGKELCIQLAKKGCHIAVIDINLAEAENTAAFIKSSYMVKAKAYKVDVTDHEQVIQLAQSVERDLGVATILVNNAGILICTNVQNPDWQEVQHMINVNLTAHFWTIEAFMPKMKQLQKGHIVAISSIASMFPLVFNSQYTATKFALRGLMRSLRQEMRLLNFNNIHLTTAMPFFLNTNRLVATLYQKSFLSIIYPMIEGDLAAKSIVDGLVRNEKEMALPAIFELLYRIYEVFPVSWQDWIIYQKSKHYPLDMF